LVLLGTYILSLMDCPERCNGGQKLAMYYLY
jgi:hypothetical protein